MRVWRGLAAVAAIIGVLSGGPLLVAATGDATFGEPWHQADRSVRGLAPDPGETREAVVQVYSARAFDWRGVFAVHTWVATKARDADAYVIHQVTGWGGTNLRSRPGLPDRNWFGNRPSVLREVRGEDAERAIERIEGLLPVYPYRATYRAWPGPNSNTFVAWLLRRVPELAVALPSNAIGKDYLDRGVVARTPSGSGFQFSAGGYLGLAVAVDEGFELNLLGLVIGVDPRGGAFKLPGMGDIRIVPRPGPAPTPAESGAG